MKKLTLTMCFVFLMLALTDTAVFGQIKIPGIFKPKQNPPAPKPNVPNTPNAPNAPNLPNVPQQQNQTTNNAQTNGASYVDDGFTWFEAVSTTDPEIKQNLVYTGWTIRTAIRVMGIFPKRSAIKTVVSRNGKTLISTRCEAGSYNSVTPNPADVSFIYTEYCWNSATATKETGKLDVEIFAINGGTNAETSVRKYKIDVIQVDRVNTQTGKLSAPAPPRYVISRHAEAPVSLLYVYPTANYPYNLSGAFTQRSDTDQVEIIYSISPPESGKSPADGFWRCAVDGKRVPLVNDLARVDTQRQYQEIYTDRIAPQYKVGVEYKDEIGFQRYRVRLNLQFGSKVEGINRLYLNDFPGKWECSIMLDGEKQRTFRWTIGGDGKPVKHPEQNGNINLFPSAILLDTEIPANGTAFDKRLAPVSVTEGFFYGQKWTSAEGKAAAARVPIKGSLLPVPSNKVK